MSSKREPFLVERSRSAGSPVPPSRFCGPGTWLLTEFPQDGLNLIDKAYVVIEFLRARDKQVASTVGPLHPQCWIEFPDVQAPQVGLRNEENE